MRNKQVLIDTSIWVNYFRNNDYADILTRLFDDERVVINDVILSELLPAMNLYAKKILIGKNILLWIIKENHFGKRTM